MFPSPTGGIDGSTSWQLFSMQFPFVTPFTLFWPGPWAATSTGQTSLPGSTSLQSQPGSASQQGQDEGEDDSNVVDLLCDEEALEFSNFDSHS